MCPGIDNLIVTLLIGNETHVIVVGNFFYLFATFLNNFFLLWRNDNITEVERKTGHISHTVTQVLDTVEEFACLGHTHSLDNIGNQATQCLLGDDIVEEAHFVRNYLIDDDTANRSFNNMLLHLAVHNIINDYLHLSMQVAASFIVSNQSLFRAIEGQAFTLGSRTDLGDVVETEHHILRWHCDRSTIGRIQDIVALKHQNLRLQYSLVTQGKVDGHLVTVEVSVECSTCQRVQLNSLTLNHLRLESLNTETVKCRRTVEHDRMSLHYVFKDIPDNRLTTVYDTLCALDRLYDTTLNELANNKRLVKFSSHQLRKTTLAHFQFRSNYNNRTGRIVNTLTQQVLAETALLTLQRVRKRLQRAIALALHSRTLA